MCCAPTRQHKRNATNDKNCVPERMRRPHGNALLPTSTEVMAMNKAEQLNKDDSQNRTTDEEPKVYQRHYTTTAHPSGGGAQTFKLDELLSSAADLQTRTFDPLREIVPGILPEGLTVLAGKPKVGKSWKALDMAIAVSSGGSY